MINFIDKKTLAKEFQLLAKSSISKNAYASIYYAKRFLAISPNDTYGLILISKTLFDQKNYSEAIKYFQESMALVKNSSVEHDQEVYAQLLFYELRCKLKIYSFEIAQEEIKKTFAILDKLKVRTKDVLAIIEELEGIAKQYLQSGGQKTKEEVREEAFKVHEMLKKEVLGQSAGQPVYILARDWFNQWKRAVGYDLYFPDLQNGNHATSFDTEKSTAASEEPLNVGYISQASILDDSVTLFDLNQDELYTNFPIKQGLSEEVDFMIISEELWDYLYSLYGGIPIKRFTYFKDPEDTAPSVEINVILYPLDQIEQPRNVTTYDAIYISITKTIKELSNKIHNLYKMFFSVEDGNKEPIPNRLWKIDPHNDFRTLVPKIATDRPNLIPGSILADDVRIYDAEISDNDLLVLEYQVYKDWIFQKLEKAGKKPKKSLDLDQKTLSELEKLIRAYDLSIDKDFNKASSKGLCGLQNLGNTCFMNSSLQCLSHTMDLTTFFLSNEFLRDLNQNNPLGTKGRLAIIYSEWIKEMWMDSSDFVSPWDIKKAIGKFAPQFYGYGQQDSGELLSYLLDGLHEDLNRVKVKPSVETPEFNNVSDDEAARETWVNHLKRNQSKIQELMHGQFKSRLDCPDCSKVSITFDPFATVPLPIPTDEYSRFELYYIPNDILISPTKINFNLLNETLHLEIKAQVANIVQEKPDNLLTVFQKDNKILEFASDNATTAQYFRDNPGVAFIFKMSTNAKAFTTNKDPKVVRLYVYAEGRYFYESDKLVSYARLIEVNSTQTVRQVNIEVYKRMRGHIQYNFDKTGKASIIDLKNLTEIQIEKEFRAIFDPKDEKNWPFKLYYCHEDLTTQKRLTKSKPLPVTLGSFYEFAKSENIPIDGIVLELKVSKAHKWENFALNRCKEHQSSNPQDSFNKNYTIYDCLTLFTKREKLEKDNSWYCSKCKDQKEAYKKMEIYKTPDILIFHLKRFKTSRIRSLGPFYWASGNQKFTTLIDFPVNGLDLTKYVLNSDGKPAIYDLYAVSNHYGNLNGGHYTAFCKNTTTEKWYEFDDTKVNPVSDKKIVSKAAYLLFYARRQQVPSA